MLLQIWAWINAHPETFLLTGFIVTGLIILADLQRAISLNIPGPRRLSFAGIVLFATVMTYSAITQSFDKFIQSIAFGVRDAIIFAALIAVIWWTA